MDIKVVFHKSTSKHYNLVCSWCENYNSFYTDGNVNTIYFSIEDLRHNFDSVEKIISTVGKWKKSFCYFNEQPIPFDTIYKFRNILKCEMERENKCEKYCYGTTGWGCKFIDRINLHGTYSWDADPWYSYGYFCDSTWIVEKDRISDIIQNEIDDKYLTMCKFFSYDRIYDVMDEIPEEILVTNKADCRWQIEYREAPIGIDDTKMISIKPRSIPNSFYFDRELSESGSIEVTDDLELELLRTFRECDWIGKLKIKIIAKRIADGKSP